MKKEKRKEYYSISVMADMLNIHPQTIRLYEKRGIISPRRTEGNTRLFSEEDLERIKMILTLTEEMGVNLAGVEVILKMRDQFLEMQKKRNEQIQEFIFKLIEQVESLGELKKDALMPLDPLKLTSLIIKKDKDNR